MLDNIENYGNEGDYRDVEEFNKNGAISKNYYQKLVGK